jgi:AmmeMemoRadiSam system protein A
MDFTLTAAERAALLADARETIAAALERREPRYVRDASLKQAGESARAESTALRAACGAFVTLHQDGELRGCIGRMTALLGESAMAALEETVRLMAWEAAFGDPRFPPLTREEFPRCDIEISALSPMEPCTDPGAVVVGTHGLYLSHRGRTGVLLPQVPLEQGWDRTEYLDYICVKAGLPPRSFEAPGAKLYTFTALVFGEKDAPPDSRRDPA